jgi:hypothetical protein
MSETSQPKWKCVGRVGDADPIAYGGGFVYQDTTGIYPPAMTWFEEATDEDWKDNGERCEVTVYHLLLEKGTMADDDRRPHHEWWWGSLADVAQDTGVPLEDLEEWADSTNPMDRACLYRVLIHYHGVVEFDPSPVRMTEKQAYEKFAGELKS